MGHRYKASYYNFTVPHGPWTLLFNGVTSGLMRLPRNLADELLPFFSPAHSRTAGEDYRERPVRTFDILELPPSAQVIFKELLRGRFFISSDEDETAHLKKRYEYYRHHDPFLVTIATTLDCNLDCYYCYQGKSKVYMTRDGCDRILNWIQERIEINQHERLYIDWYGGEPMLNQDAIEYVSARAIAYCESHNVGYSSAIISNGTLWPEDAIGFIKRTNIKHVQFTLDGPRAHHDKRRHFVGITAQGDGSFDRIVATIDRLIGKVRIYLRVNVDPWNYKTVLSLVEYFQEKGWFATGACFYPYLAMIGPLTEHCSLIGTTQKSRSVRQEFNALRHEFQSAISQYIDPRGIQHLQYYPMTVKINCAAVGQNSVIFGPDGLIYKCCLEVGDTDKAHDRLPNAQAVSAHREGDLQFGDLNDSHKNTAPRRWVEYSPFHYPRCVQCQYLPICFGGCPKMRFDRNEYFLDRQCNYWEENFDAIIRTYYDTTTVKSFRAPI